MALRRTMSTYVLVPGAWRGSWIWRRVRRLLQARGHEVFTPTPTGVAERVHLSSPSVNLETHITDVSNLIRWEDLSDVILCGHSYGGCVISGVADQLADRIGALVYLDAFVLENGQCLDDTLSWRKRRARLKLAKQLGEGWKLPPISAETFNVNAKDRDWVNRQTTMQSLACFEQPLRLTGAISRIQNLAYILATGWSTSPFLQFYKKAKRNGWRTVTIECGHDVMLDRPEELARELMVTASHRALACASD
jgi:pimeloyl-ACP methyl ester carboxylesterase